MKKIFDEDWEEYYPKDKLINDLHENGFYNSRMISGSKSLYRKLCPNDLIIFNANIFTKEFGKIWYGDLNLTRDSDKLKEISEENNIVLYILSEMDGRFDNENQKNLNIYIWNTKDGLSERLKMYYNYKNLKKL